MISEPGIPVYACARDKWEAIKEGIKVIPYAEDGKAQIELWNYSPQLYANRGTVDRLSLFLSLKDKEDERIAKALDEMMEHFEW